MSARPELQTPRNVRSPLPPGLEGVLEAVADGVLVLKQADEGCLIDWASRRLAASTGLEPEDLVGRPPGFLQLKAADGAPIPHAALFAGPANAVRAVFAAPAGGREAEVGWRALEDRPDTVVLTVIRFGASAPPAEATLDFHFGAIAAHLLNVVALLDRDGGIRAQFGSSLVTGRDPALERGRNFVDYVHREDAARARDWLLRLAAAPAGEGVEDIALRLAHGTIAGRSVRVRGTNLLGEPAVGALLAEIHDETARTLAELAADRTRDHLRLAAEGVGMGFFEYDVPADTVEVSDECYVMRGFAPPAGDGAIGGQYLREAHPDDESVLRHGFDRLIVGPADDWDCEFRVPAHPGQWIWVHQRTRVLERGADGAARRIVGILLDVDRRKRAEQALAASEARYRTVVAMSPGFVHEIGADADGRLLLRWASEGFTRILGWTIEEVNAQGGVATIVHDQQFAESQARGRGALGGAPGRGETRLRSKSGEWVWFAATAFPLQEPETGRVTSIMGTLHDITGLKLAEERLRASEERFRLAADAVSGVIYERDVATGMITASGAIGEVLGLGPDALRAHVDWWLERIHPDDRERVVGERMPYDDGQPVIASRYRLKHADGHYVDIFDRAVRVRNERGEIVRVIGCALDVSREGRAERLLSEAEALAHVGSWELDLRRQELNLSDEAHRLHGTDRATFKPTVEGVLGFYAPEDAATIREAMRRAVRTGEGFDLELELVAATGERRWVRTNGRAELIDGKVVRLYGAIQDIEARRRSELRIQEQSDLLRLAMDAAQVLAWRWHPSDDRFVVEYRSPAFDVTIPIGRTLEEDLADTEPEDRARVRTTLERTARSGVPAELEFRIRDRAGRLRWLATRIIQGTANGEAVVIGATYEVTARRASEDALRSSEAVLRSVSENSPDHILVADADLNVRFVNRGGERRTPIAVVGGPLAAATLLEPVEMERHLRAVLATGRSVRFEARGRREDGSEMLFENRVGPVEQGGRITGVIVYSTDITDRRALEREILEISNREQRRIGSDLHDGLGQELTGIALMLRGLTSALERGAPLSAADLEEVLALVNGAIDTTRTLARGLSPVALEGGGLAYALRALTAHAREMYGIDIRFRSRLTSRVTLDAAATGHLYRIAQESLTNTARHARAKLVTVQLSVRGRRVTLSVTDDGRGIAGTAGAGMGLKIMRYRAHMLGGELSIEPAAEGTGTRIACTVLQPDPDAAPGASPP